MNSLCRLKTKSHGEDGQWEYDEIEDQRHQIEALTAQVGVLREALDGLLEYTDPKTHNCFCECDPSVGYQCAVCHWPTIPEVRTALEALATTPESALSEVRKAERERVIDRISAYFYLSENFKALAEEVRAMGDE